MIVRVGDADAASLGHGMTLIFGWLRGRGSFERGRAGGRRMEGRGSGCGKRRCNRAAVLLAVGVSLVLGGCQTASSTTPGPSPTPAAPASSATTIPTVGLSASSSPLPSPTSTAGSSATCAERTLGAMTEAQRIGQLLMVGLADDRLGADERLAIATSHFGSFWFTAQTTAGVPAIRAVADAVQAQASGTATAGVRFFVAANQEGGVIQALSGPGFGTIPAATNQGTLAPAVLEADARAWGIQLRAAGVNLDFAPVADVVPPGTDALNAPIGQLQREFGHDAATVDSHVVAFIRGMQEAGVATTVKHFPGLGRVRGNTDVTGAVTDAVTTLQDPYLGPFSGAVEAGVPFVMVSLATYERIDPAHLAAFSPTIVRDLLRDRLQFGGVVISDDLGATVAVSNIAPGTRAIDFLAAGGDMIISKTVGAATDMVAAVAARAAIDAGFRARVDDAVLRVLAAKDAYGLLPCS